MQYPLLFIYGKDGYHLHILCASAAPGAKKIDQTFVTMFEYYAYHLHPHKNEAPTIFKGGRLFQQFIVNWYAFVQQARLDFIGNEPINSPL